jgi:hypothetical protein
MTLKSSLHSPDNKESLNIKNTSFSKRAHARACGESLVNDLRGLITHIRHLRIATTNNVRDFRRRSHAGRANLGPLSGKMRIELNCF